MKYGDKPMRILLPFLMVGFSAIVNAAPPVTHQFTNGTTIEAAQVNANYQELADRIEVSDNTATVNGLSTNVSVLQGQVQLLQTQLEQALSKNNKQLIGFTTTTILSAQTSHYLNSITVCQNDFPGSTVCVGDDIKNTVNVPTLPENSGAMIYTSRTGIIVNPLCLLSNGRMESNVGNTGSACVIDIKIACCR